MGGGKNERRVVESKKRKRENVDIDGLAGTIAIKKNKMRDHLMMSEKMMAFACSYQRAKEVGAGEGKGEGRVLESERRKRENVDIDGFASTKANEKKKMRDHLMISEKMMVFARSFQRAKEVREHRNQDVWEGNNEERGVDSKERNKENVDIDGLASPSSDRKTWPEDEEGQKTKGGTDAGEDKRRDVGETKQSREDVVSKRESDKVTHIDDAGEQVGSGRNSETMNTAGDVEDQKTSDNNHEGVTDCEDEFGGGDEDDDDDDEDDEILEVWDVAPKVVAVPQAPSVRGIGEPNNPVMIVLEAGDPDPTLDVNNAEATVDRLNLLDEEGLSAGTLARARSLVHGTREPEEIVWQVDNERINQVNMRRLDGPRLPPRSNPENLWLDSSILAGLRHSLLPLDPKIYYADTYFYQHLMQLKDERGHEGQYNYRNVAGRCKKSPGKNILSNLASYLPILVGDDHWIGCAILPRKKQIMVYNSLGANSRNRGVLANLWRLVKDEYARLPPDSGITLEGWSLIDVSVIYPRQANGMYFPNSPPCHTMPFSKHLLTDIFRLVHLWLGQCMTVAYLPSSLWRYTAKVSQ